MLAKITFFACVWWPSWIFTADCKHKIGNNFFVFSEKLLFYKICMKVGYCMNYYIMTYTRSLGAYKCVGSSSNGSENIY